GNYQDVPTSLSGSVFSMPAYFNNRLYYGAVNDVIKSFQFSNARLVTPATWTTPNSFAYPGATPSISANGGAEGIVWAVENTSPAILHAYSAADLHQLYSSNDAPNGRDQFGS